MRLAALLAFLLVSLPAQAEQTKPAAKAPRKITRADSKGCERIVARSANADPRVIMAHAIGRDLDMARLRGRLEELSGEKPLPDGTILKERGSEGGRDIARNRIAEMLSEMGYRPQFERFSNGVNVIAELRGSKRPNEVLEITAHYDSVGNPGADDNGSGIALLLELAAFMPQFKPESTIRFTFMDLEEKGFQGSRHHTKLLAKDGSFANLGTIVIDTIGWAQDGGSHYLAVVEVGKPFHQDSKEAYDYQQRFAAELFYLLNRIGSRDGIRFSPELGGAKPYTADHGPYWDEGLPAILIAAPYEPGFINPSYHDPEDKIENMNWKYYELVSKTITELVAYRTGASVRLKAADIDALTAIENQTAEIDLSSLEADIPRDPALPPKPKTETPKYQAPKWDGPAFNDWFKPSQHKPISIPPRSTKVESATEPKVENPAEEEPPPQSTPEPETSDYDPKHGAPERNIFAKIFDFFFKGN